MNNELRRNAEGYVDPTAAATLTWRESGDIWRYKDGECLVIKGHKGIATILRLHDNDKWGDRIKVVDRPNGPRYVDPAFIVTGRYQEMSEYIETLPSEVFTRVIRAVEDKLGIQMLTTADVVTAPREEADSQEVAKLREEVSSLLHRQDVMQALINEQRKALTRKSENAEQVERYAAECTKARNQLELLREMYDTLLTKVVGGGD